MQLSLHEIPTKVLADKIKTLTISDLSAEKGGVYPVYNVGIFKNLESLTIKSCDSELAEGFLNRMDECNKLTALKIEYCNITKVPEIVFKCESLVSVNFESNKLTSVPMELIKMPLLKGINVSYNKIKSVNSSVAKWMHDGGSLNVYSNGLGVHKEGGTASFYGKIVKIEEINELFCRGTSLADNEVLKDKSVDGIKITFEPEEDVFRYMYFLINNQQDCCESWGSVVLNDNPQDFIGAKFISLSRVLAGGIAENACVNGDEDGTVFINIETDRGTLQLKIYNNHNGYYAHYVGIYVANELGGSAKFFEDEI